MAAYLRFVLNGVRYALDARAVLEIVRLAELSPAEEAPPYIAGLLNLRGRVVPVINLDLRLGHPLHRYQVSDCIVMLESQASLMGIIVNEVSEVVEIDAAAIEPVPSYDDASPAHARFVLGNAKVGAEIVMLLDVLRLLHTPTPVTAGTTEAIGQACCCPEATQQERAILLERARSLMQPVGERTGHVATPISLVQFGGEHFGVDLELVREFAHLSRVTPIPCCPPHIAGNMNLRGDILTLVDIRGLLNVATNEGAAKVMVIESDELLIGVPVEQVFEVIYLQPEELVALPAAAHEAKGEYCRGAVRHRDGMISILDMHKILAEAGLEVEQEA